MRSNKRAEWQTAMQEEIAALEDNEVWRFIKRSPGSNALHLKWVYKTKTGADGELERHKARLVASGNEQVLGVVCNLIFAAVMDISTVKVILALAATWGGCRPSMATSPTRMSRLRRRRTCRYACMYCAA